MHLQAGSDCWLFLGGAQVNEWALFASRGGSPAPKAQALLLGRDDTVNLSTQPTHPVSVDSGGDFGTAANSEVSQCSGVRPFCCIARAFAHAGRFELFRFSKSV